MARYMARNYPVNNAASRGSSSADQFACRGVGDREWLACAPISLTPHPGQINIQVPYEVGSGPAVLAVNREELSFSAVPSHQRYASSVEPGQRRHHHLARSGWVSSSFDRQPLLQAFVTVASGNDPSSNPSVGAPGSFVTMYVTGAGEVSQSLQSGVPASGSPASLPIRFRWPVNVTVGGIPALIQFAGASPGVVGLIQLNLVVPSTVAHGRPAAGSDHSRRLPECRRESDRDHQQIEMAPERSVPRHFSHCPALHLRERLAGVLNGTS